MSTNPGTITPLASTTRSVGGTCPVPVATIVVPWIATQPSVTSVPPETILGPRSTTSTVSSAMNLNLHRHLDPAGTWTPPAPGPRRHPDTAATGTWTAPPPESDRPWRQPGHHPPGTTPSWSRVPHS